MHFVVLGASAAGINGAATIRKYNKKAQITLISTDTNIYSRCILHYYMDGKRSVEELSFIPNDFMSLNNINWIGGVSATGVKPSEKQVMLSNGDTIEFDKLLIATGSSAHLPPIEGLREAKNVFGLHDLNECQAILEQVERSKNVVVIGAGLVGVDAISGLLHKDISLSLVELKDRILPLQLDKASASTYEKAFETAGVKQYYSTSIKSVHVDKDGAVEFVKLSDGTDLPCELLIVAGGVRANTQFLEGSGVELDKFGLVIDSQGKTSCDDIYGAGDVTGRNPIWPMAVKEGIIAASNMCGILKQLTDFFSSKATMNFCGIPTLSVGIVNPENESEYTVDTEIDEDGNYKKIVHSEGKIYGAILQGNLDYSGILTQLIKNSIDISRVKKPIFRIDYSDFFQENDRFEFYYND